MRKAAAKTLFFLCLSLLQVHGYALGYDRTALSGDDAPRSASLEGDGPDIEWFKKEMGISSKYTETESGVMGLSWAHFLTMLFLTVSFVAALVAVVLRHRRSNELIELILKEESQNGPEG